MPSYGVPTRADPGAAIQTWLNQSARKVMHPSTLPQYGSYEAALADPTLQQLAGTNRGAQTNYLRDVYGLSGEYAVKNNGSIGYADPWLARNAWWLAPAAMVGGPLAFQALAAGGGAGAAAGVGAGTGAGAGAGTGAGIGAGLTTGAAYAAPTSAAAALGGASVATGGGMTLGSILGSQLLGQGVNAGAQLYGAHKAGQANDRASAYQAAADERTYQLELQRDAEARRQWEATQEMEKRRLDADEEERSYRRGLDEAKETRLAPYRQASQVALGQLLGLLQSNTSGWLSPSQVGRR